MKILIIEDGRAFARVMADILKDLGEIVICTSDEKDIMPKKSDVLKLIAEADLVLLDNRLDGANYMGSTLVKHCAGKKLIGISSSDCITPIWFSEKMHLHTPEVAEKFKKLVADTLHS